mmetsp:Transcript_79874/g.230899  ORF Transcript_79874/g.230899 Transcript_79874/m.230899 type:complete len:363 (-) Transcript_79874:27-1115(-)
MRAHAAGHAVARHAQIEQLVPRPDRRGAQEQQGAGGVAELRLAVECLEQQHGRAAGASPSHEAAPQARFAHCGGAAHAAAEALGQPFRVPRRVVPPAVRGLRGAGLRSLAVSEEGLVHRLHEGRLQPGDAVPGARGLDVHAGLLQLLVRGDEDLHEDGPGRRRGGRLRTTGIRLELLDEHPGRAHFAADGVQDIGAPTRDVVLLTAPLENVPVEGALLERAQAILQLIEQVRCALADGGVVQTLSELVIADVDAEGATHVPRRQGPLHGLHARQHRELVKVIVAARRDRLPVGQVPASRKNPECLLDIRPVLLDERDGVIGAGSSRSAAECLDEAFEQGHRGAPGAESAADRWGSRAQGTSG